MFAWRDLDFRHSNVRVTAKALWGFRPKNWEERVVPLPSALIDQLQRLKRHAMLCPRNWCFPIPVEIPTARTTRL